MKIHICDRCGKKPHENENDFIRAISITRENDHRNMLDRYDLCGDCENELYNFLEPKFKNIQIVKTYEK